MKTFIPLILILFAIVGGISLTKYNQSTDPEIISTKGIHWHPELKIFVDGVEMVIPENIGLIDEHSPIHTHDDLPIIHLEFNGIVRREDTKLKNFFMVWQKDIRDFGDNVSMTVNGVPNQELGEYEMKHEDKIVLNYSK